MRYNLIAIVTIGIFFADIVIPQRALGQGSDDCITGYTKFDVCAAAKEIQRNAAPNLPMQLSAEMTLMSIMAIGGRVGMNVIWHMTEVELNSRIAMNNTTLENLRSQMQSYSRTSVCSREVTAAFVRLGGEMQYHYTTNDGFSIASPLIKNCG